MDEDRGATPSAVVLWSMRLVLIVGAALLLQLGFARFRTWEEMVSGRPMAQVTWTDYWLGVGLALVAALLLTVALRVPFRGRGFAWWTVAIAVLALCPVGHLWYLLSAVPQRAGWLGKFWWWDSQLWQPLVFAVLAGVAVACGIRNRRPSG